MRLRRQPPPVDPRVRRKIVHGLELRGGGALGEGEDVVGVRPTAPPRDALVLAPSRARSAAPSSSSSSPLSVLLLLLFMMMISALFLAPVAHPGGCSQRRGEGAPAACKQARGRRGVVKVIVAASSARRGFLGSSSVCYSNASAIPGQEGRIVVAVVVGRRLGAPRPRRRAEAEAETEVVVVVESTCSFVFFCFPRSSRVSPAPVRNAEAHIASIPAVSLTQQRSVVRERDERHAERGGSRRRRHRRHRVLRSSFPPVLRFSLFATLSACYLASHGQWRLERMKRRTPSA